MRCASDARRYATGMCLYPSTPSVLSAPWMPRTVRVSAAVVSGRPRSYGIACQTSGSTLVSRAQWV
jgi:tetrahydromethanopterin S-methyltransferase subunit E